MMKIKIRTKDKNEFQQTQIKLLKFIPNLIWMGGDPIPQHKDGKHLYVEVNNLLHGNTDSFFENHSYKEAKLIKDTKIARKLNKKVIAEKDGYILVEV